MAEQQKPMSSADMLRDVRQEHEKELAAHDQHLCVRGTGDVLMLTGALGLGLGLGFVGSKLLMGRWRLVPLATGTVLLAVGYTLNPARHRFVKKASLTTGGISLLTSSIIFTFADKMFKEEGIS